MFNVICIDTGAIVAEGIGTGAEAAAIAREHTETSGKRHQPRRVTEPNAEDWKERERGRFADGTYTAVPWASASWIKPELADHFVHVSTKKPGLIAYTPDAEKGAADRQVPMKPGAYLTQFYSDELSGHDIRHLANQFSAQYAPCELRFADTEDDIERVYTNGPSSCMSHAARRYNSPFHPVRVYAAGDIAVAYVVDPENEEHISARCLCRPAKKLYSRVYGDETRLVVALERAGFACDDAALEGARMQRVEHGSGFVAPYIDYVGQARDNGEYLIIGEGDVNCGRTDGLSDPMCTCDHCNDGMDEDDSFGVGDENWCRSCYENYAFYCEHCDETIAGDNAQEVHIRTRRTQTWCADCVRNDAFECEGSGDTWHEDQRVELDDGTVWCMSYYEDHGGACEGCSSSFNMDDMHHCAADGAFYCEDCLPAEEPTEEEGDTYQGLKHRARQGRDESPDQLELTLPKPAKAGWLAVGDTVNVQWPYNHIAGTQDGLHTIVYVDVDDAQGMPYRVAVPYLEHVGALWVCADWIVPNAQPATDALYAELMEVA